ncbi:hypothetical protein Tco_1347818 [Tanacetum coccineum]
MKLHGAVMSANARPRRPNELGCVNAPRALTKEQLKTIPRMGNSHGHNLGCIRDLTIKCAIIEKRNVTISCGAILDVLIKVKQIRAISLKKFM